MHATFDEVISDLGHLVKVGPIDRRRVMIHLHETGFLIDSGEGWRH